MYRKNDAPTSRFAVCPVKKYGNAVRRNKAKRICRELYRTSKEDIKTGFDIVFVIYPEKDTYKERKEQFTSLLDKARLLIDEHM